ncbi:MAG TPA: response regulator [Polyangiaceae bacterium]|nr:response regulator [Polyangiaceae bacterium]
MLPSEPPVSRIGPRRPRILLVDDDPSVIRSLWRVLRRHRPEFQVNTAAGAAHAIEALSERGYDLVLTDWHMPGGGGRALLDALVVHYPETARVVHSSRVESGDTVERRLAHIVIAKPASDFEILTAIDSALLRVALETVRAAS